MHSFPAYAVHLYQMCIRHYAIRIYECGDRVEEDFKFTPYNDQTAANHTVKSIPMGSNRVKGKCGKYNCINP